MAIPLLQDDPVFQPIPVASRAPGLGAISQGIEELGNAASKAAERLNQDRSSALLYSQYGTLIDKKIDAQDKIQRSRTPVEAAQASLEYKQLTQHAIDTSRLTRQDKNSLKGFALSTGAQVDEAASRQGFMQSRMNLQYEALHDLPNRVQQYTSLLYTNPTGKDGASDFLTKQTEALNLAYEGGAITKLQKENSVELFHHMLDKQNDYLKLVGDDSAHAHDYHAATAFGGQSLAGSPANSYTAAMHYELNTIGSYDDAVAQLHKTGTLSDPIAYSRFTPEQQFQFGQVADGVRRADSLWKANIPLSIIQGRADQLAILGSGKALSTSERGELDQLKIIQDRIKNNYLDAIQSTAQGANAQQHYQLQANSIMSSTASDEDKNRSLSNLLNETALSSINLGKAQHIDPSLIKPVLKKDVDLATGAFNTDADPRALRQALESYNSKIGNWFANSVSDPLQAEVTAVANLSRGTKSEQLIDNLVAANQKGRDFSSIEINNANGLIKNSLSSYMSDTLGYINGLSNGNARTPAILNSLVNYVKAEAIRNNDPNLVNLDDYAKSASQIYNESYGVVKGNGYAFTKEANLNPVDMANVVKYMRSLVEYKIDKGLTPSEADNFFGNARYTITNNQLGQFLAINSHGKVLQALDISSQTLEDASAYAVQAQKDDAERTKGLPDRSKNPFEDVPVRSEINR